MTPHPDRQAWKGHLAFFSALIALNLLLEAPRALALGERVALHGESWAVVGLLALLLWLRPGSGAWRVGVLAVGVTAVFAFEGMLQVGALTMGEPPLLYDAAALSRHLLILGRDLYGARVYTYVGAIVALVVGVGLTVAWLLSVVEQGLRERSRARLGAVAAILGIGLIAPVPLPARWTTPHLVVNLTESAALWQALRSQVRSDAYAGLQDLALEQPADLRIYIVESYGAVLATDPRLTGPWEGMLEALEADLSDGGWHIASTLATAPVVGGRSWLADATVWLGMPVRHQSTYQHLLPQLDRLPHLPRFLRSQGYETVLVKPKDRERPGVRLDNSFDFAHTVFYEDLSWTGRKYGWGIIPDQYTVGFVEEEVLDTLSPPRFAFFHLVSSHVPWASPPPVLESWRHLPALQDAPQVRHKDRQMEAQVQFELRRFKRDDDFPARQKVRGKSADEHIDGYTDNILYTLGALAHELRQAPEVPTLMLWMGDHQPPLLVTDKEAPHAMDVPIHALATDPSLLTELLEAGFTPGMRPALGEDAPVHHEGLFSLIVRALARSGGEAPPPYYPLGTAGPPR